MSLIVGVHGMGNYKSGHRPEEVAAYYSKTWTKYLSAHGSALPDDALAFAYYAHHLRQGMPVSHGPEDDALDRLIPEEAELADQWINALKLNVPELTAQGRLGIPLRNIVTALARHFSFDGRLTRGFIATCLREVNMYMRHPEAPARLAAREEVASVIAAHQPRIVIAHSLGSVVTYEALHAHPELRVELLVTVGSPLALPHGIFQRLQPAPVEGRGSRPPGVGRWINLADHGDPVAILRPLKNYFSDVDMDLTESLRLVDIHCAKAYLRSPALATALTPYL
ncbi:hypothetical protein HEP85_38980 [Streptomyces sp. RPA4-2]|uniref:hypothetical protein n=1 Tax=Streptomyces sp. RPA4-2 TaxID=2721244 RepID=UPI00143E9234|nr:hypothetical protein [Streptomyces sp. RPA4-2]QIY66421.1 hypothetical protein HEP85_38980 [Streptomyces sp. RPA4-2]